MIDTVHDMSVRIEKASWQKLNTYSKDVQPADLDVSVNFRLDPTRVSTVYSELGATWEQKVLYPAVLKHLKEVFGRYTAVDVVGRRAELNLTVEKELRQAMTEYGVLVEAVQIENIKFSDIYERAVETAMQAQAEVQKTQQQLARQEIEAKKTVVDAQAQADKLVIDATARAKATIAQAQADAQAVQLRGEAEGKAIKAKADALAQNAQLVTLVAAEKWDGKLPTTMVPGSTVPFIGVR
jgi:regulator of protease activity HflC (stomatin/prohibitin superfamily)